MNIVFGNRICSKKYKRQNNRMITVLKVVIIEVIEAEVLKMIGIICTATYSIVKKRMICWLNLLMMTNLKKKNIKRRYVIGFEKLINSAIFGEWRELKWRATCWISEKSINKKITQFSFFWVPRRKKKRKMGKNKEYRAIFSSNSKYLILWSNIMKFKDY